MKNLFVVLIAIVLTVFTVNAQTTWKLDIAHSKVQFAISHMVISEVTGRFKDFDATLTQTKDDFTNAKLEATIKVNSIDTDNESRDKHLKSPDFFDVEKYQEIKFVSKPFEKSGKDKYKITGALTMHGITKMIVLDTKFNGQANDPWGNTKAGFKATAVVNRKDFGIVYNTTLETGGLLIGEDVEITISVEMAKEKR